METQPELQVSSLCRVRESDLHGSGWYQAPRGHRKHKGTDLVCVGGTIIRSCSDGVVTRSAGIVYSDPTKSDWRYIEITDPDGFKCRYFYVKSIGVEMGLRIKRGDVVGVAQGIETLYDGITPHIHVEVKNPQGKYINPDQYLIDADNKHKQEEVV